MNKGYIFGLWVMLAMLTLQVTSCTTPAPTDQGNAADTAAVAPPVQEEELLPPPPPPVDDSYEMLGNMEMVMYCLPYPKAEFEEDFEASAGKGHHVLRSKDKKATITFTGAPLDMDAEALLQATQQDIASQAGASQPSILAKSNTGFHLKWTNGANTHQLRKWIRASEHESVTAEFQYPTADAARHEAWVKVIVAQPTDCQ